ncbi:MAG: hypothetical protein SGPRY_009643, partial [Prymnesium sp.]
SCLGESTEKRSYARQSVQFYNCWTMTQPLTEVLTLKCSLDPLAKEGYRDDDFIYVRRRGKGEKGKRGRARGTFDPSTSPSRSHRGGKRLKWQESCLGCKRVCSAGKGRCFTRSWPQQWLLPNQSGKRPAPRLDPVRKIGGQTSLAVQLKPSPIKGKQKEQETTALSEANAVPMWACACGKAVGQDRKVARQPHSIGDDLDAAFPRLRATDVRLVSYALPATAQKNEGQMRVGRDMQRMIAEDDRARQVVSPALIPDLLWEAEIDRIRSFATVEDLRRQVPPSADSPGEAASLNHANSLSSRDNANKLKGEVLLYVSLRIT